MSNKTRTPVHPEPFWDIERDGVTQSLIASFLACPQKATYRYRDGLTPLTSTNELDFGTLFHAGLESLYTHFNDRAYPSQEELRMYVDAWAQNCADVWQQQRANELHSSGEHIRTSELIDLAHVTLLHYVDVYIAEFVGNNWLGLEWQFEVHYPTTWRAREITIPIRGKIDGAFRLWDETWLFETKTKARIDDNVIQDRLTYDLQCMLYCWAIEQLTGERPAGIRYNLVRRSQLYRRKGESHADYIARVNEDIAARPDHYFLRYDVPIHSSHMNRFLSEFDAIIGQLLRWANGEFNYRCSSACSGQGRACEFLALCSRGRAENYSKREAVFAELQA